MDDSTSGGGAAPAHWDKVYAERTLSELSWFEPEPTMSLEVIESLGLDPAAPIVDVGGGASSLVDALIERGHLDLTVLDLSAVALRAARDRIGRRSSMVHWAATDLREWRPTRRYRLWHDRAVFHFLVDPADRKHYRDLLVRGVEPGGFVLLATFAPDGPPRCSGLPVARYDADGLATAIGPGFTAVSARHEVHRTPVGADQPFTWLLLRHDHDPS